MKFAQFALCALAVGLARAHVEEKNDDPLGNDHVGGGATT